jgi:hypothetical protein
MKNFLIPIASLLLAQSTFTQAAEAALARKPNFVFILADDLGNGNISAYCADNFKTPNIEIGIAHV